MKMYSKEELERIGEKRELLEIAEELGVFLDARSNENTIIKKILSAQEEESESEEESKEFVQEDDEAPVKKPVKKKAKKSAVKPENVVVIDKGVVTGFNTPMTSAQTRNAKKKEANELVRIVVNCQNPNKKQMSGEIFTVSNSVVGTFRKFVPFNVQDGWHVPRIIVEMLKEKECQVFVRSKDSMNNDIDRPKIIKEYSVTELPKLTPAEIKALAKKQQLAQGKQEDD